MVESTGPVVNDLQEEVNKKRKEIENKTNENLSRSKPADTPKNDENNTASPDTPNSDQPKKEEKKSSQDMSAVNDGISRAYADDMPPQKPVEKKKSKSSDSKPPERGKAPKVAGGKDIMEVAWNEFWAFCDSVIDGAVDLTFDFLTFALYPASKKSNDEPKKEMDIIEIGQKVHEENVGKINKTKEYMQNIYHEINQNIDNAIAGEKVDWPLLKQEPAVFARLLEAKRKVAQNPSDAEAKKVIENWNNFPTIIEKMAANNQKIAIISDGLATAEEYITPVSKKKEEEIKAAQEKYNAKLKDLTEKLKSIKDAEKDKEKRIKEVAKIEAEQKESAKKLKETISAIEEKYKKPEDVIKANIAERSQKHKNNILQNINTISMIYLDNPDKMHETIGNYMETISEAFKKVRNDVYVNMYEKNNNSKTTKETAQKSIMAMTSAVNDFKVEDKPLKSYAPRESHETVNIDMREKYNKLDFLKLINNSMMTR